MKFLITSGLLTIAAISSCQAAETIVVTHPGAQPSVAGGPENFIGTVRIDARFHGSGSANISGGTVTFAPGARTAWHTHPRGQTLIVTAGVGLVQSWGKPAQRIQPGDQVWIPPMVKHWHGACATHGMTHIAIVESEEGQTVAWLEQVSDEQYGNFDKSIHSACLPNG